MSARLCASYGKHGDKDSIPFGFPGWVDLKGSETRFSTLTARRAAIRLFRLAKSCPRLQVPASSGLIG
jgi:hypothetical protein